MCGKQAELFRVLGVESRIKIIELLKRRGPLGVSEIAEQVGLTPSAVSQHLKILRHAGLVQSERKGFWIPYDVDPGALEGCCDLLSSVCHCHRGKGGHGAAGQKSTGEELEHLRRQKKELERRLKDISARIDALDRDR
jgi:DNA-binding transcriptional ArsR family regulator